MSHIPCIGRKLALAEHSLQQLEQFYHVYICHRKYHHSSYSDAGSKMLSLEKHHKKTENIAQEMKQGDQPCV
jgi:hypothetical protein